MQVIGLTGGIASGKSTVGRMLRAAGVPVIDADELAREAVAPGSPGLRAIVDRFGEGIRDETGALRRGLLGQLVFADPVARTALNAIVHPEVQALALGRLRDLDEAGVARAVYEVPLLFENHLEGGMHATLLVVVPAEVQRARLMARDGLSEADAQARIDAQMPLDEKKRRATYVIDNEGELRATASQLGRVWFALTGDDLPFAATTTSENEDPR